MWDPPRREAALGDDRLKPVLLPRPWQVAALASLARIREQGYSKALVAVATGLGKTWLAAFDVIAVGRELGRPPRVLVIAHRAEILAQAEATLRQAIAPASVSYVAGASCDLSGQLVIASIQKPSRPAGLAALDSAASAAGPAAPRCPRPRPTTSRRSTAAAARSPRSGACA